MVSLTRAELDMFRSVFKQLLTGAYDYWDDDCGCELYCECTSLEDEEIEAMLEFCNKIFTTDELREIVNEVDV